MRKTSWKQVLILTCALNLQAHSQTSSKRVQSILHQYILPGTVVMTDGWRAYRRLSENGDLEHHTINHSLNFVDPNYPSIHTQTVERMWRSLKKVFPVGGRPTENLHLYISEFLYRQANPKLVPDLCPIFLTDIVKVYPGYGKPVDQSKG